MALNDHDVYILCSIIVRIDVTHFFLIFNCSLISAGYPLTRVWHDNCKLIRDFAKETVALNQT
ncbi:MAG: hypothetical protein D3926_00480 [Desulfobacteraceae bacterium]|nr:MAG: hypothetical protein D3926_00480 [Desulfobacteraceae bacterium]